MNKQITYFTLSLVILLGLVLALIFVRSDKINSETNNSVETVDIEEANRSETGKETSATGTITGSLTYPSDRIPDELEACAENTITNEVFCTKQHIEADSFVYGIGYELEVAPGSYRVFAKFGAEKSFYNPYMAEFASNQEWPVYDKAKCSGYSPSVVAVSADQKVENIALGDWYWASNCTGTN